VTGFDVNGNITCGSASTSGGGDGCIGGELFFSITSLTSNTIEQWPGGQQTLSRGDCSVIVQAPTGDIDVIGGTEGSDGWSIVGVHGFTSATGVAETPVCSSFASSPDGSDPPVNNRPSCSNASSVFESGHSTDRFGVTVS
jgi:hypothetical protein